MLKVDPMIELYMTPAPRSIEAKATLQEAKELMTTHDIRHLPVTDQGKVVGILSDRDLKLAYGLEGIDPSALLVADVCQPDPYVVDPQALLREVAQVMAVKRYGSAIVMKDGRLAGIFTTVDACRALVSLIEARSPKIAS